MGNRKKIRTSGGCTITSWPSSPTSVHSDLRNVKRAAKAAILAASTRLLFRTKEKERWNYFKQYRISRLIALNNKSISITYPPLSRMWRSTRMDHTNFPEIMQRDSVSMALLSLQEFSNIILISTVGYEKLHAIMQKFSYESYIWQSGKF